MEHHFTLPVTHNGEPLELKGRLVTFGYTFTYYIIVNNTEIIFERDNDMHFRAIYYNSEGNIDETLLAAISVSLEKITE